MTIEDFKIKTPITVQWGDMDALQHVNNVKYVAWGEAARIDYMVAIGLLELKEYLTVLGFQSVKYIVPVFFPDKIVIGTNVDEIKKDRIVFKSYFFSEDQGKLVAIKTHELYLLDSKTHKKLEVPQKVIDIINSIEE